MLRIHNTLTKTKEIFKPIHEGKIGMYVCGVTVYDLCHIGHARTFVNFDVIVRYLRHRGYDVTYVRNITDIDDKIIRRANERGVSAKALAEEFIAEHSMCHPGRPSPQGEGQEGSPGLLIFQSTKS